MHFDKYKKSVYFFNWLKLMCTCFLIPQIQATLSLAVPSLQFVTTTG